MQSGLDTNCYLRSKDESPSSHKFHAACDDKGPSLVLWKLDNDYVGGGYTTASWASTVAGGGTGYTAATADNFLFSLTNGFRHDSRSCNNAGDGIHAAIYSSSMSWPTFGGGHDFNLGWTGRTGYVGLGNTYACRIEDRFDKSVCADDFAGSYNDWTIEELEVWVGGPTAEASPVPPPPSPVPPPPTPPDEDEDPPPPEECTPSTPTICSKERWSCSATTRSGATPCARSHAATFSAHAIISP